MADIETITVQRKKERGETETANINKDETTIRRWLDKGWEVMEVLVDDFVEAVLDRYFGEPENRPVPLEEYSDEDLKEAYEEAVQAEIDAEDRMSRQPKNTGEKKKAEAKNAYDKAVARVEIIEDLAEKRGLDLVQELDEDQ